ncbi:uncharacterized protein LOC135847701 [Planococcus citri]|uniref:uncharacterized protein LOC135847701 n=1 Tax=Planococcus citri TaxID=170843 RepID=UPI0031F7303D
MTTSSMLRATLAILIGANLIVCIKTDANSLVDSKKTETNIEPLSSKDFSSSLRDLLSPDVFTQADPFRYLLGKTMKYSFKRTLDGYSLISKVDQAMSSNAKIRFPSDYLPYAKLLSSLLRFFIYLESVHTSMVEIQKRMKTSPRGFRLPDINSLDPEISQFFSPDVLSDTNTPMVLVDELLHLPGNSLSRVAEKLIDSTNNNREIGNKYYDYAIRLSHLLTGYVSKTALINLQSYVGSRNANGDIVTPAAGLSKLK